MRYAMTEDVSAQSFISELDELVFLIEGSHPVRAAG